MILLNQGRSSMQLRAQGLRELPALASPSPKLLAGLAVAAAIASLAPFDAAFAALTLGSPLLRATGMVACALVGLHFAHSIGLGIEPREARGSLSMPLLLAGAVAVECAAVDWAFRPLLHGGYVAFLTGYGLPVRLALYMMRAFNENILYRLFLGSLLIWAIGRVWRTPQGRPARGAYWLGFALSQAANVWINVSSAAPVTAVSLLHDALRYFLPGMVWSRLYWRRGFQSNEIASTIVHLFFQPLVTLGLAAG